MFVECGLSSGSKVMVLGKKHDPTQEQAFKDILNLGKRTALIGP